VLSSVQANTTILLRNLLFESEDKEAIARHKAQPYVHYIKPRVGFSLVILDEQIDDWDKVSCTSRARCVLYARLGYALKRKQIAQRRTSSCKARISFQ
jgi:hypothetical protein